MKHRLASLVSGGGTTMEAIVKACSSGQIPMDFACLIVSDSKVGGVERAKGLGIPDKDILIINPDDFKEGDRVNQEKFGEKILVELKKRGVTTVTQNGWKPLTPGNVIDEYKNMIFNQHPGPLPDFGGKGMFGRRVLAARLLFVRLTGRDFWTEAVVQRVAKDFDAGAVVKSQKVEILESDTIEDLQARVLPIEHKIQIEFLKDVAAGTVGEEKRESLVAPGEQEKLNLAKEVAALLYPQG